MKNIDTFIHNQKLKTNFEKECLQRPNGLISGFFRTKSYSVINNIIVL